MSECLCPVDHSITKLGHCRTCPFHREDARLPAEAALTLFVCGTDRHADGTPHDFDWATYADDFTSYGVCRCGMDAMSKSLWEAA